MRCSVFIPNVSWVLVTVRLGNSLPPRVPPLAGRDQNAILDWSDAQAHAILANCRRAIPADGALLLIDFVIPDGNSSAPAKLVDIAMLVLTGGKVRTVREYAGLLAGANFRLSHMIAASGLNILQAIPS
jgi:hypothetical protein